MKKLLVLSLVAAGAMSAFADIAVTLPKEAPATQVEIISIPLQEYATNNVQTIVRDTVAVNGSAVFATPQYDAMNILVIQDGNITVPTRAGEKATVDITSLSPVDYTLGGTPLLDSMQPLAKALEPVVQKFYALPQNAGEQVLQNIYTEYDGVVTDFIKTTPNGDAAVYAFTDLQKPETVVEVFPLLVKNSKSFLYPMAESRNSRAQRNIEMEKRQNAIKQGAAPDFTLPNLEGKQVSLSDFRGKWVVLDFWGSWCRWCIKGFPALKDAYKEYEGKLEIIGVDCGDSPEAWRAAVEKYKLPWVQVYNADSPESVEKIYGVQGYPTKMIVNPEGHVVDVTTGEDPSFFDKLRAFVNK